METLEALAVRCEAAAESFRNLDCAIFATLFPGKCGGGAHLYARVDWTRNRADWAWLREIGLLSYTSSIEAAMKLIPEGWRIRMLDASVAGRFSWSLTGPNVPIEDPESPGLIVSIPGYACATGQHIAATLAAAALRAHLLAQKDEV